MGSCFSRRQRTDDHEMYSAPNEARAVSSETREHAVHGFRVIDPAVVDHLVMDMLSMVALYFHNDEATPEALVKLHNIADKEDGWIHVVMSLTNVVPLEVPLGPSTISIVFNDCPLPTKQAVMKLRKLLLLSENRALDKNLNIRKERNICIVLCCIADKLAGPVSSVIFTRDTLDYLFTFIKSRRDPEIVLFALIALEKFAHMKHNKDAIQLRIDLETENPLLILEKELANPDYVWKQVGFCAKWILDNVFPVRGRILTYQITNMSKINVILSLRDISHNLKVASDALEARCDSNSFESVRSTFQVDHGCWYYECVVVTAGVMQIGWATNRCHFSNNDGYGIGDDPFSVSFDGCRQLVWYRAKAFSVSHLLSPWKCGDVVGCLLDMDRKEAIFSLNGVRLPKFVEIFNVSSVGFFGAASFMAFEQCRFNFGHEPFLHPPTDRKFLVFNGHGILTPDEKRVIPTRILTEQLLNSEGSSENLCTICFDDPGACAIDPCTHNGFCKTCIRQLRECPMCRSDIAGIQKEVQVDIAPSPSVPVKPGPYVPYRPRMPRRRPVRPMTPVYEDETEDEIAV